MKKNKIPGFSFIQIVVILMVIAALAIALVLIFKPTKVLEKSRDSQRFADIKLLSQALNQYLADNHDFEGLGGPYSSIDPGFENDKARQKNDGAGWLPVDFRLVSTGPPIEFLPLDPLNNTNYNYRLGVAVKSKTYELNCQFEAPENIVRQAEDDGNNPNIYEIGTDLTIL